MTGCMADARLPLLAIHMFFDCLALAMGLLASVMATWPRNETFTYGCAMVNIICIETPGLTSELVSLATFELKHCQVSQMASSWFSFRSSLSLKLYNDSLILQR